MFLRVGACDHKAIIVGLGETYSAIDAPKWEMAVCLISYVMSLCLNPYWFWLPDCLDAIGGWRLHYFCSLFRDNRPCALQGWLESPIQTQDNSAWVHASGWGRFNDATWVLILFDKIRLLMYVWSLRPDVRYMYLVIFPRLTFWFEAHVGGCSCHNRYHRMRTSRSCGVWFFVFLTTLFLGVPVHWLLLC